MTRIAVRVAPRPYDAMIENGLLERAGAALREVVGERKRLFVVTVPPVKRRWGKKLASSLKEGGFEARFLEMADGERAKKLATVEKLAERLSAEGADRNCMIVAFGGGVVGDVAGLLASVYMRGVDVVQIPTTVLAQVDASIGGKTGVNLRTGKNLLGTFHQPLAVLIDPDVLSSLPAREFAAGLYESLKCGVIGNEELFRGLERVDVSSLRREPEKLTAIISASVRLKAEVVSADEREGGLRRVLNFGHTIGHALEAGSQYRRFLHGEAVGWGMIAAAQIAAAVGKCDAGTAERIREAVLNLDSLPRIDVSASTIMKLLQADKKTKDGVVHFVLPRKIGAVEVAGDVPKDVVRGAVDEVKRLSRNQ